MNNVGEVFLVIMLGVFFVLILCIVYFISYAIFITLGRVVYKSRDLYVLLTQKSETSEICIEFYLKSVVLILNINFIQVLI